MENKKNNLKETKDTNGTKDENIDIEIQNETEEKELENKEAENELNLINQKFDELEDKYKRNLAEFENYKKRTEKEKSKTYILAKVDLIEKLLPVLDSINSAMKISEDKEYIEGLEQVNKQLLVFLKNNNVEEIKTIGETFDPKVHEAISMVESDKEEGTIIEEFRKGYKIGDDVIRHSMVIVSK